MNNRALVLALGFSCTLHLGLFLGWWINGGFTQAAAPDALPTLKVSLVVHMAEPEPETVEPNPPEPEPKPPQPAPVVSAKPAPVKPQKPTPAPEEKPAASPQTKTPSQADPTPATRQAEPTIPALDEGYLQDLEQRYMAALRQAIEARKYYPRRARRLGHQGSVRIEFTLEHDGRLQDIRIAQSSGSRALDKAALKAVRTVGRFEPIPEALEQRRWPLDVALNYELE